MAELVDCTGLENRRAVTGTGGSNPSLSAYAFTLRRLRFIDLGFLFFIDIRCDNFHRQLNGTHLTW